MRGNKEKGIRKKEVIFLKEGPQQVGHTFLTAFHIVLVLLTE